MVNGVSVFVLCVYMAFLLKERAQRKLILSWNCELSFNLKLSEQDKVSLLPMPTPLSSAYSIIQLLAWLPAIKHSLMLLLPVKALSDGASSSASHHDSTSHGIPLVAMGQR